jgi:hypothetical protein
VVLGIPAGSPERDIRRAYRRLAKQLHPDRAAPADRAAAHARFIELRAAYEAMLAQAAVVEVGAEEGAGPPKGEVTFRPAGRQRGDPATGTGVVETGGRRSRPWMHWAVGLVAIAALTVGACVALIGVEVAESDAATQAKGEARRTPPVRGEDTSEDDDKSDDPLDPASASGVSQAEGGAGCFTPDGYESTAGTGTDDASGAPERDEAESEGADTWGGWFVGNLVEFRHGMGRASADEALHRGAPYDRVDPDANSGDSRPPPTTAGASSPPAEPDSRGANWHVD